MQDYIIETYETSYTFNSINPFISEGNVGLLFPFYFVFLNKILNEFI